MGEIHMKIVLLVILTCVSVALVFVVISRKKFAKDFALSPETKSKIKPRLVTADALKQFTSRIGSMPSADFFGTSLKIVYVVDAPNRVMYLNDEMLVPIGIAREELHKIAVANLQATTAEGLVVPVIEKKSAVMIKTMDGFDAARLILIPSLLKEDQELAAVVPDRDTLGLLPKPEDWGTLKQVAESAVGDPLFTRPLLVTSKGVSER